MIGWAFRIASLCLVVGQAAVSRADSPWFNLLTTSRVEADPAKQYTLQEEHGPWIIMACSFNGERREQQAHDLVLELRKRYCMEAFAYCHKFDLDDPNGNVDPLCRSPHRHTYHIVTENPKAFGDGAIKEIAVVVGNFSSIDDPDARRTLQKLKAADPECLHATQEDSQSRSLALWRTLQAGVRDRLPEFVEGRKQTGPLAHAFLTRNPLRPDDCFATKAGVDDFILKINKNVKYSLLDCPGKYTVQVAHFTGEVILNQNEIREIESGIKPGPESTKQTLATAAEKAHELTEALRMKGYEAYEFHDRTSSQVTVGHFDCVGTLNREGMIVVTPEVNTIIQLFVKWKSLVGIFFDGQPIPVEVPKRSISRQLGERLETAGQ